MLNELRVKTSECFGYLRIFLYLCTRWRVTKQAVALSWVLFQEIYSRTLNWEQSPNRNPKISQSSASPLYKESCNFLQSYEKSRAKQRNSFLCLPRQSNFADFSAKLRKDWYWSLGVKRMQRIYIARCWWQRRCTKCCQKMPSMPSPRGTSCWRWYPLATSVSHWWRICPVLMSWTPWTPCLQRASGAAKFE